jgi:protein TonB
MSLQAHGGLYVLLLPSPSMFPVRTENWGSGGNTGGIDVKIVGSVAGINLPAPEVVTKNVPANDSAGLYKSEEAPPPPPPSENTVLIPDPEVAVRKPPPPPPKPVPPATGKPAAVPDSAPANAVPFGQGGKPDLAYGQFATGVGSAGVGFDDGAFGERYGYYVDVMTRRISENWLRSLVDNRVQRAPRVYLSFVIGRDGKISDIVVVQPSGISSLDRSAERAIRASDPLPSLPTDYRGSSVQVKFYFEYSR